MDTKTIERRIAEGRGQGEGKDYISWIKVSDFSSLGFSSRPWSPKTEREHHLFSKLELNYFRILEFSPVVLDIREQYPLLPQEETIAIAERLEINYPLEEDRTPIVMTTDFLLTVSLGDGKTELQARSVKPSSLLKKPRTLEKLEIERQYWNARSVDWGIVTEHEIPPNQLKNIEWVYSYRDSSNLNLDENVLADLSYELTSRVLNSPNCPLAQVADEIDKILHLRRGDSLRVVKHLIASGDWIVQMDKKIDLKKPLRLLNDEELKHQLDLIGRLA